MTHHYPPTEVTNKHQPGTKEAIEQMHIQLFGNTDRIKQGIPTDTPLERLEKIERMLRWNQDKIDNVEYQMPMYSHFDMPFTSVTKLKDSLEFNQRVRARLIQYWNRQLERMKM